MYCFYWKHADTIYKHESLVNAIAEYIDVIDNIGLEVWIEDDLPLSLVHLSVYENEMGCGLMVGVPADGRITEDGDAVTCPGCREQVLYQREELQLA